MPDAPNDANKPAASSTVDPDANKGGSWDDYSPPVKLTADPSPADKGGEPTPPKGQAEPIAPVKTEPKPQTEQPKGEPPVPPEDYSDVPFHEHARFKELLNSRNELRKASEEIKPLVESQRQLDDFLRANNITAEQFREALEIQSLINSDPEAAMQRLQPVYEHLSKFRGEKLPDDLAAKVERGVLTEEDAREWAKQRAVAEFKQQHAQQTQLQREQQEQFNALNAWETNVRKNDPDFDRKGKLVYSRYVDLVSRHLQQRKGLNPSVLTSLADEALKQINDELAPFIPKGKPTTTSLNSGSAPFVENPGPKTWDEVEEHVIAKYTGRN